jgi:hypothetical protein
MPARYELIAGWVNENGWTRGAELGIFDGRTHLYLLQNCPNLHLIGVDVWDMPGFSEGQIKSGERCFCRYCGETRASRKTGTVGQLRDRFLLNRKTVNDRSRIMIEPTQTASRHVEDGSLDFVFIDADHSKEGVSGDIEAWRDKVRPGGWIIGHDFNMQSVRDAVHEHFSPADVVLADDHVWFVRQ